MSSPYSFLLRMPAGIPGDISRKESATVEPQFANSSSLVYGRPVKLSSGYIVPISGSESASDIYGLLVRPYPTNSSQDPVGTSTPPASGPVDVLKRGYMTVLLGGTAAATKGGVVYVRVASASSGKPIGGIEAAADGGNTVIMANSYFMGPADADGNVEVAFNI